MPATSARYQISSDNDSGHHPFWSPDGRQLFYWAIGGSTLVSTSMVLKGSVTSGRPERVPGLHPSNMTALGPLNYDITPDGREFVLTRRVSRSASTAAEPLERGSVKVVLNWFEESKRSAPGKP